MHATKKMGPMGKLIIFICVIAIAILWWKGCTTHAQESNPRTTVVCGGGPEHQIFFVPKSRPGQHVTTCDKQMETWYENANTKEWRAVTEEPVIIHVRWTNQSFDDQYYGPKILGVLEWLQFYPGGAGVPPKIIYKTVGGKLTILNARPLAEVNHDLDAGKEAKQ